MAVLENVQRLKNGLLVGSSTGRNVKSEVDLRPKGK
jgi:hypothetical protein